MGINQLLKALKTIVKPRKISDYANMRVAVDTYCWLHKGIYSCAVDIIEGRSTDKFIAYCLRRVEMLLKHNIKVVMVFDGGKLPMKRETEESREKKRAQCLEKAQNYMQNGDRDKAQQQYAAAIDVTTEMANALMRALQEKNIECIVAPYEADAQLAYLSRTGYVDVIITEDSDLLAFGAKKIFYKMEPNGVGQEICLQELPLCTEFCFTNWTNNMFLTLCIMSGCDYVDQIPQVGFKTAYIQINRLKNYKLVISFFMQSGKYNVPADYLKNFEQAFLTFRFQTVFDPISRKSISLNSILTVLQDKTQDILEQSLLELLENSQTDFDFLGRIYEDLIACSIADGMICPIKLLPFPRDTRNQQVYKSNQPINKRIMQMPIEQCENSNIGNQQQTNQEGTQMSQQTQAPIYGEQGNRQMFKLAEPLRQKKNKTDTSSKQKQTLLKSFFKPKKDNFTSQEFVDQLLYEPEEQQPTQNQKLTQMKPFKTPAQVLKQGFDMSGADLEKTQEDKRDNKFIEESNINQSLETPQTKDNQTTEERKLQQETYQYDDLIMKGVNNLPVVLSKEILNRKLEYNNYGDYMSQKIMFETKFNFNY